MDSLFEIEPTTPRWRQLAGIHGIQTSFPTGEYWLAEIEWFGANESDQAESEREAVIALIHRLKLNGWETVSL